MAGAQATPTGVARIGAAGGPVASGAGINVAIIDTGIDDCHPDLKTNVKGGVNIIDSTKSASDDNGHGTHVAGTVAAIDNGFGVVGVAPGASLYAVKVLDASGSGSLSNIVTALDWATHHGINVANLSLGAGDFYCSLFGLCGQGTECTAISNAVASGITVVVAAGNSADETLYYTPANCRDSLTVSAFADSDGKGGGSGAALSVNGQLEVDDTFAQSFSNFSQFFWDMNGNGVVDSVDHPVVDVMAPGVAIRSTLPTYTVTLNTQYGLPLNYGSLSGTSMATPHVSGAVARYLAAHPGATPEQVRLGLIAVGECRGAARRRGCTATSSGRTIPIPMSSANPSSGSWDSERYDEEPRRWPGVRTRTEGQPAGWSCWGRGCTGCGCSGRRGPGLANWLATTKNRSL